MSISSPARDFFHDPVVVDVRLDVTETEWGIIIKERGAVNARVLGQLATVVVGVALLCAGILMAAMNRHDIPSALWAVQMAVCALFVVVGALMIYGARSTGQTQTEFDFRTKVLRRRQIGSGKIIRSMRLTNADQIAMVRTEQGAGIAARPTDTSLAEVLVSGPQGQVFAVYHRLIAVIG
ncbi:hypothetical protein [Nereida ignava]|uniref:hypothetical protein n=1 Tax=Nereida ignava TaxID=282199 RepID=UPI0023B59831